MNTHINTESYSGELIINNSPVYKQSRLISYTLFIYAVLFFASSFVIFFLKRTYGVDPHMVSGAYPGTVQLLVFVLANSTALFMLMLGYYLYRFSGVYENIDEEYLGKHAKAAMEQLGKFLKLLSIGLIASLVLLLISLVIYLTL
jgi:hypothetical protein